MQLRPPGSAADLAAAVLLLLLLTGQAQAGTPGPRCDCANAFMKRYGPFCCQGCPAGHFMETPCTEPCGPSTCLPCPQGTFLTRKNHFKTECSRCQTCDEGLPSQVALENCSAVADTRCGCQPGWQKDCVVNPCRENSPFSCHCVDCETSTSRSCLPGYYEHGNVCIPCPTSISSNCPKACTALCGWKQMFWVQVVLAGLVVPLLLGAALIYTYRRCRPCKPIVADTARIQALTPAQTTHLSASDSAHSLLAAPPGGSEKVCTVQVVGSSWTPGFAQTQEVPCRQVPQSWDHKPSRALGPPVAPPLAPAPPAGSPAAVLQPGPQLYDVMDAVPARRWKEFVRTLGLREAEIEAVEVEICRFRDQQYEMLKRWRQQQPAGLGAVYAALERMGLEGCAEDLRSRLQRGP